MEVASDTELDLVYLNAGLHLSSWVDQSRFECWKNMLTNFYCLCYFDFKHKLQIQILISITKDAKKHLVLPQFKMLNGCDC